MKKALILLVFCFSLVFLASHLNAQSPWRNVCPDPTNHYCRHVGKTAHNAYGPEYMREIKLGKIIGVAWRPKGSVIGISKAIPKAGIPQDIRLSPRNAFYYIIDAGWGESFLRQCREIRPK